ncbi:MAG: SIS domain-containing protein [Thermomicrobiales bacterium]|nr:SIS domain-containing protein [Thermomicrobiales bacterium]
MSAESASGRYLVEAAKIVERIATTQLEAIDAAAAICTQAIGTGGLVHAFGTGHSRIPVEALSTAWELPRFFTRSSSSPYQSHADRRREWAAASGDVAGKIEGFGRSHSA